MPDTEPYWLNPSNPPLPCLQGEVLPGLRARLPGLRLVVVGAPPTGGDSAWSFASRAEEAGVRLVGRAEDLLPFLSKARVRGLRQRPPVRKRGMLFFACLGWCCQMLRACKRHCGCSDSAPRHLSLQVFVSPIRDGTGLNTKNVLALTHGIPLVRINCADARTQNACNCRPPLLKSKRIPFSFSWLCWLIASRHWVCITALLLPQVTTRTGAAGMFPARGASAGAIAIADDPRAFADAVLRLYSDAREWERQASAGAAFSKQFCPDKLKRDILDSWRVRGACGGTLRIRVTSHASKWMSVHSRFHGCPL